MIERQTINGRPATVAYMTADFVPADKDTAPYAKVLFDDGEMLLLASGNADDGAEEAAAWNRHRMQQQKPYGQPPRKTLLGYSLARWAAFFAKTDIARIDNAIKTGLIAGLDNTEIARRVIGSIGLRGIDGVTEVTRRRIAELGRLALKERKGRGVPYVTK